MFFRHLTYFRFPTALDLSTLEARLDEARLKPVGPLEMFSRGFVSPFGREDMVLAHRVGSCIWITVGGEDKILPGAVVNEFTARKAAEIEEREGRKLGGRARRKIKDEVLQDLLPKAFIRPVRSNAYLDLEHALVCFIGLELPDFVPLANMKSKLSLFALFFVFVPILSLYN